MTAPKPTPTTIRPALAPVKVKPPKLRYPGTDSVKWNVRNAVGAVIAKGLPGFAAADKVARELGGTAVRA